MFVKSFVMTNMCLSQQKFCHDKHTFVMTKDTFYVCHDKSMLGTTKLFVATNICHDKSFADINILSQ